MQYGGCNRMDRRTYEQGEECAIRSANGRMDLREYGVMDGRMDAASTHKPRTDGRLTAWTERMDGWMNPQTYRRLLARLSMK